MNSDIKIFGGIILGTAIIVLGAVFFLGRGQTPSPNANSEKPTVFSQKALIGENSWSTGSESAKVSVVEFGDYQCPTCKNYEPIVSKLQTEYKEKLFFVYRHFPLIQIHEFALTAASAAEAAGNQGKFWEYHKKLYEISPNLSKDNLLKIAKDLNLDMAKFEADMDSDASRQKVLDDLSAGTKLKVSGTPTFFINGKPYSLSNLQSYQAFKAAIDKLNN